MEPYNNGDTIFLSQLKCIVSFYPSITETLAKLSKADNIVEVSAYCVKFLRGYKRLTLGPCIDSACHNQTYLQRELRRKLKFLENISYLHGDVPVIGGVRVIYPKI